jgi:hypothetical protein
MMEKGRKSRGRIVDTPAEVAADLQQVEEHAGGIVQDIYLTAMVIIPGDANLVDGIPMAAGDDQQFNIKRPAGESLAGENIFGNAVTETFKATLGILQAG